jgi:hypothetical protein
VLSSKSAKRSQILSYVAALGCIIMAIPSIIIGGISKATGKIPPLIDLSYLSPLTTNVTCL